MHMSNNLVGNVGIVSCRRTLPNDMPSAGMQTCHENVGNVGPTCRQVMSSGPCQTTWHVVSGQRQSTCRLILDIKKKCVNGGFQPSAHSPPTFMSPNHDKPSAASGSMAFGLVVSGLAASGSTAFGLMSFGFSCDGWLFWVQCWLVQWCGSS
jgi:hypothetical protein